MASFKLTRTTRALGGLLVVGLLVGGLYGASNFLPANGTASFVPTANGALGTFDEKGASTAGTATVTMPTETPVQASSSPFRLLVIPWNAQAGALFANGGPATTQGSLMEKYGVNLQIERQDDYGRMKESLASFATELASGVAEPAAGAHFVTIMGDGAPYFMASLNGMLKQLGPDYQAEVIGGFGRSYGEDKFMGPPACVEDPNACKGKRIAGVLLDGDWNIAMYWAAQNGICVNSDVKTYDEECLNWYGTSSFTEADEAYIAGRCEDLPVVRNGKKVLGGGTKRVCIDGVVTWFPGDEAVTTQKGGLATILSTRENSSQMPSVVIGIKAYDAAHAEGVTNFLRAGLEGGTAVRSDPKALVKAGAISAAVYKEGDAAYWLKGYKGYEVMDKSGQVMVSLGGSRAFTPADAFRFFGLESGAANAFEATYNYFGALGSQAYPTEMPSFPSFDGIFNPTYLRVLKDNTSVVAGTVDAPKFDEAPASVQVVAKRSWSIQFATNSADFTDTSALEELMTVLTIADNTKVEIHGYTDNVGDADFNMQLSDARARAVKSWLTSRAGKTFPAERIDTFAHGESASTGRTRAEQARDRRVEIVLKSN